jgi:hypothetical protein
MSYTTEQLDAIAVKLRALPPIEKKKQLHSKQEAVRKLAKDITAMQKNGYTLDEISKILRGEGLDVATPTLKSYLQRARPTPKKPLAQVSHGSSATQLEDEKPGEAPKTVPAP